MAPHWKCGLGQPIAGSNPALSATSPGARRDDVDGAGLPPRPVTRGTHPEIIPLEVAEFTFADDEPLAGQTGVVMAYVVRHREGVLLFDTGFGFGNVELDAYYRPRARRLPEVLAEAGIALADVGAVVNCHLHVDHAGQNACFPGIPIYVQPAEWEIAHTTDHTILEWIDFAGARYEQVAGDHEPLEGIHVLATPGHTPGHQSLAVETAEGVSVLAGQAVYTAGEWEGDPDAREGRSRAPDPAAYDRSVERLRGLRPARVFFGHDRRTWTA
jgi:N-acyl homoserine lactone hydrolase